MQHTYGFHHVSETGDIIRREVFNKFEAPPKVAVVLGSGLGDFAESLKNSARRQYGSLPYFSRVSVEGHTGELVAGEFAGRLVAVLSGRTHGYEGLDWEQIVFPVRALAAAGVETFILTSSVGAINIKFSPGDLVVVKDHISFFLGGDDPLRGSNFDEMGVRFPDMSEVYNSGLRRLAYKCYEETRLTHKQYEGVLAVTRGPYFETPAEVQALRILGADLCGMSMVPETIALSHMASSERFARVKCLGLACVTNMAAGVEILPSYAPVKIEHEKNVAAAEAAKEKLFKFLGSFIRHLPE